MGPIKNSSDSISARPPIGKPSAEKASPKTPVEGLRKNLPVVLPAPNKSLRELNPTTVSVRRDDVPADTPAAKLVRPSDIAPDAGARPTPGGEERLASQDRQNLARGIFDALGDHKWSTTSILRIIVSGAEVLGSDPITLDAVSEVLSKRIGDDVAVRKECISLLQKSTLDHDGMVFGIIMARLETSQTLADRIFDALGDHERDTTSILRMIVSGAKVLGSDPIALDAVSEGLSRYIGDDVIVRQECISLLQKSELDHEGMAFGLIMARLEPKERSTSAGDMRLASQKLGDLVHDISMALDDPGWPTASILRTIISGAKVLGSDPFALKLLSDRLDSRIGDDAVLRQKCMKVLQGSELDRDGTFNTIMAALQPFKPWTPQQAELMWQAEHLPVKTLKNRHDLYDRLAAHANIIDARLARELVKGLAKNCVAKNIKPETLAVELLPRLNMASLPPEVRKAAVLALMNSFSNPMNKGHALALADGITNGLILAARQKVAGMDGGMYENTQRTLDVIVEQTRKIAPENSGNLVATMRQRLRPPDRQLLADSIARIDDPARKKS